MSNFLEAIPEERIVHEYMKTQGEGKSTEYCNGWNNYRSQLLENLKEKGLI